MSNSKPLNATITLTGKVISVEKAKPREASESQSDKLPQDSSTSHDTSKSSDSSILEEDTRSIVEYYGPGSSSCGYCKRDGNDIECRRSYDMKAYQLRAGDYQALLDKGWRRSGNYCYNPINDSSCCPNYTMSCKALKFKLSRSQRRCIENLNSFLVTGNASSNIKLNYLRRYEDHGRPDRTKDTTAASLLELFEKLKTSSKARDRRFVASCERKMKLQGIGLEEAINKVRNKNYSRRPVMATLEDYLYPQVLSDQNGLKPKLSLNITMQHVESSDNKALRETENRLIQRYQEAIHKESATEWSMSRYCDFLVNSPIIVEPLQDLCNQEYDANECLTTKAPIGNNNHLLVKPPDLPTAYGTYHCVYQLNDQLIAVGVLDVLPKCITTVYFFYNPDYGYLNLGTYSALLEISMVRQMFRYYSGPQLDSKLIYYYLGFYVHECKKMKYKTTFKPSYLLCSEMKIFVPTITCLKLLEGKKYSRFAPPEERGQPKANQDCRLLDEENQLYNVPIMTPVTGKRSLHEYLDWLETNLGKEFVNILVDRFLRDYVRILGPEFSSKIVLQIKNIHRALVKECERRRLLKTLSKG